MPEYLMGQNDRERRRLALQGMFLNPLTEGLLRRAGIGPGMTVLELGCGIGDVSMMAARLVGPTGKVVSLDMNEDSLEVARQRSAEAGISWIEFRTQDLNEYRPERGSFDAVVGRYILVHAKDPAAIVRLAFDALHSAGVAAFHESDFSAYHPSYPEIEARKLPERKIMELMIRATHANLGTRLAHLMLEAGFLTPDCRGEIPFGAGAESHFYEWFAETVRSLMPPMEAMGIVQPGEIEVDTLAARMREEAVAKKAALAGPTLIGCFARKP